MNTDDDTIAIVTYGSDARALLQPTPVSDTQTIIAAIDRLQPGGSTNMEAGLRTGYAQAKAGFRPDGVNSVILASDGVANVGVDDPLLAIATDPGGSGRGSGGMTSKLIAARMASGSARKSSATGTRTTFNPR